MLAFVFVVYAGFSSCIKVIKSEETSDILKPTILPAVILLILGDLLWMVTGLHAISESFLSHPLNIIFLPFHMLAKAVLPYLGVPADSVFNLMQIVESVLMKLGTLGILITLDILLLILAVKNRRLTNGKPEFTLKRGILLGVRYLIGAYQLIFLILIPSLMVEGFWDPNTGLFPDEYNHGITFFLISPLVLYSFAYIIFCKYFFKESKRRNVGIAISLLPFLFVIAVVIFSDSVDNFTDLYQNGSTGAMLYLYAARDLILLALTTIGMMASIFVKRIPAIQLTLVFYALIYYLTMFSLPEYWIARDVVARIQKGDSCHLSFIVDACSDATPVIITILDEADWQESVEYMELRKQGRTPACVTCFYHYKYEWVYQHSQKNGVMIYNFSREKSTKMIEEKLKEAKKIQEKDG